MKYPAISLVLLLSATAAGSAQRVSPAYQPVLSYAVQQPAASATPPSALDLVSGYRDAATKLKATTKVPVRLPSWVPYDDDKDNPVFASVASATANGYQVELAWAPDCGGGGACHLGYISGSNSPLEENKGPKIPVILSGGIQGYFIDAGCGANCDDSAVYWTEGGNHYSISMKAEIKETLVKMVNSALATK
jgi:hypothetical protein